MVLYECRKPSTIQGAIISSGFFSQVSKFFISYVPSNATPSRYKKSHPSKRTSPPQFSNSLHIIHLQTPLFNSPIPNREIIPILTIQIHDLITQSRFLHFLFEIVERGEEDVVVAVFVEETYQHTYTLLLVDDAVSPARPIQPNTI